VVLHLPVDYQVAVGLGPLHVTLLCLVVEVVVDRVCWVVDGSVVLR
jgi:hypothetical protein